MNPTIAMNSQGRPARASVAKGNSEGTCIRRLVVGDTLLRSSGLDRVQPIDEIIELLRRNGVRRLPLAE